MTFRSRVRSTLSIAKQGFLDEAQIRKHAFTLSFYTSFIVDGWHRVKNLPAGSSRLLQALETAKEVTSEETKCSVALPSSISGYLSYLHVAPL